MSKLTVNFESISGKIRALHSVGQPPWIGMDAGYLHYLTDAHIPYSRLHDMGGRFGGGVFVDIPNLFRDFDADPEDPASYDFAFTDVLIEKMMENGIEPYYRLGVTIENQATLKRYFTYPPKDNKKWAKICEMIIRHYNEGWADGFKYGIKYWEIWNEPDIHHIPEKSMMWCGTPEQYFELYEAASKHLKACFGDSIKIGGYAACGFYPPMFDPEKYGISGKPSGKEYHNSENNISRVVFFKKFLEFLRATDSPIDFFSWHTYSTSEEAQMAAAYCEKTLDEYGFGHVETHLNEWNNAFSLESRGTSYAAACAASMMIGLHKKSRLSIMCYYDARIGQSVYGGLFNPLTYKPLCTYYSFAAFGELYFLGNCAHCEIDGEGVYSLAAVSDDKKNKAVLISNTGNDIEIEADLDSSFKAYLIDYDHHMAEIPFDGKSISLKKYQVVLLKNY